jgi:hypothetical protein
MVSVPFAVPADLLSRTWSPNSRTELEQPNEIRAIAGSFCCVSETIRQLITRWSRVRESRHHRRFTSLAARAPRPEAWARATGACLPAGFVCRFVRGAQGPGMRPQQVRICTDGSGLARLDSRRGSRSARRRYGGDDWRLVGELRCATPSTGLSIPCSLVLTSTDTNGASGESNRGSQSYSSSERFSASASWPQLRSRGQTTTRSSLSRPHRRGRHLRVLRW